MNARKTRRRLNKDTGVQSHLGANQTGLIDPIPKS